MPRRWHFEREPSPTQIAEIAGVLLNGGVVLLPTDTIYGLHALASDARAVARIAGMKDRDDRKPFIVLAASTDQLPDLGISADPEILKGLASIWPAPLTAILPRGEATLAVRIPDLAWLRELVARTGPLVSTSANRSGEPPIDSPDRLAHDLHDALDGVADAGVRKGEPSAILDLTGAEPRFIREGEKSFTQKVWKTLRNCL